MTKTVKLVIDSKTYDGSNNEENYNPETLNLTYVQKNEWETFIPLSTTTAQLLPTTNTNLPQILVFISDQPLKFKIEFLVGMSFVTKLDQEYTKYCVYKMSSSVTATRFSVTNNSGYDANIKWRVYGG